MIRVQNCRCKIKLSNHEHVKCPGLFHSLLLELWPGVYWKWVSLWNDRSNGKRQTGIGIQYAWNNLCGNYYTSKQNGWFFFFLSSSLHLLASYGLEMVEWFIRKIRINQITKQNAFIFIWFCILPERECILGACMRTEGVFYACLSHTIKIIRIQIRIFMVIMGQLQLTWFKCDWFSTTFVTWLGFHTSVFALWLCFFRVSTRSWEGIWSIVEIFSQWRWIV